jgi:hypothetical protein
MTGTHIEGTIVLNGLIEGPVLDDANSRDRLRQWTRDLARLGIDFNLEFTGGNFSLLPDNKPRSCAQLGDSPHEAIRQALEQLLEPWPGNLLSRVTSTLRSSEYRKGEEVQSVYIIGPDRKVRAEQRTIEADTEAAPEPLSRRELVRMAIVGVVIAAALLGVTSLFVDVPALARQLIGTLRPMRVEEVEVDNSNYDAFFHAKIKNIRSEEATLTIERTSQYPTSDAALQNAADAAKPSIKKWLAVTNVARGYVNCDLYDDEGHYVSTATLRLDPLREKSDFEVKLPLRSNQRFRLTKIVFTL